MNPIFKQFNEPPCLSYLIADPGTKEAAIIDPLLCQIEQCLELLQSHGFSLKYVIDSHTHADHLSGCARLRDITSCEYVMHELAPQDCVSKRVKDGSVLNIGSFEIKILHTPGHTKDSVSLLIGDKLITGDTLFLDDAGAGRDDLPGGSPEEHWHSLQKLQALPENSWVYPAHEYRGRKPSSLKQQKEKNPFLKQSSKETYIKYLESLKLGPADWMKDVLKANISCTRDPKAVVVPTDVPACEVRGTACNTTGGAVMPTISADKLKQRLDAKDNLVLLDVREDDELKGELGHLPGIVHIPINQLNNRLKELSPYKEKTIISICKSGGRAGRAANLLLAEHFKQVLVLEGGMLSWNEKEFAVSHN